MPRGYFGIGVENIKNSINVGTLWRSAHILGAKFIFTIGDRYRHQASDVTKAWKHIPLYRYGDLFDFKEIMPSDCRLVGVEMHNDATPLARYVHPERAVYLLGAEDTGMSKESTVMCHDLVVIPGKYSLNVSTAGSIVMYDRLAKAGM